MKEYKINIRIKLTLTKDELKIIELFTRKREIPFFWGTLLNHKECKIGQERKLRFKKERYKLASSAKTHNKQQRMIFKMVLKIDTRRGILARCHDNECNLMYGT